MILDELQTNTVKIYMEVSDQTSFLKVKYGKGGEKKSEYKGFFLCNLTYGSSNDRSPALSSLLHRETQL